MKTGKNKTKLAINGLLSIFFIIFFIILIKNLEWSLMKHFIEKISIYILFLFLLSMFASFFFKSIRFYILNKKIGFSKIINITISHNFFLTLLPFRLGEIIYLKKLKKEGIKFTKSASDLVIVRFLDLFVLSQLIIFSSFFIFGQVISGRIIYILIIIILFTFFLLFGTKFFIKIINFLKRKSRNKWLANIYDKTNEIFLHISILSSERKIFLMSISYLVWIGSFLPYIIILTLLTNLSIFSIILVCTFALASSLVPINPPAGAGIIEAGWIIGFSLIGVVGQESISLSLFLHGLQILSLMLIYFISKVYFSKFNKN